MGCASTFGATLLAAQRIPVRAVQGVADMAGTQGFVLSPKVKLGSPKELEGKKLAYTNGNLTTVTYPTASANVDVFGYDRTDRMTSASFKRSSTVQASLNYSPRSNSGQLTTTAQTGLPGPAFAARIATASWRDLPTTGGAEMVEGDRGSHPAPSRDAHRHRVEVQRGVGELLPGLPREAVHALVVGEQLVVHLHARVAHAARRRLDAPRRHARAGRS